MFKHFFKKFNKKEKNESSSEQQMQSKQNDTFLKNSYQDLDQLNENKENVKEMSSENNVFSQSLQENNTVHQKKDDTKNPEDILEEVQK